MSSPSWRRLAPSLALAIALAGAAGPALARSITHGFDDDFEYARVDRRDGHDHSTFSTSTTAWERVDRLLDKEDGPVFWFSLDGQAYLVRDAATVAEARRIVRPMHELGKKQGKLGAKQGVLGARLAALAGRSVSRGGRERASMRAERRRIEEEMEELGRQMEQLGGRQAPLGEEQAILGAQQAELGRQQSFASKKAGEDLRRVARRARDEGRARRVD